MNTATFFRGVEELLFLAFAASIADAVDEFTGESIYAFILYPAGGFTSFGIAVSSRERIAASPRSSDVDVELLEMLKDHPDLLAKARDHKTSPDYLLLTACEWDYFAEKRFAELNKFLDENYDTLYDLGVEPQQIVESFASAVVSILQRAKSENCFNSPRVEADPFLGFQYPDTDNRLLMLHVSKNVNSDSWHAHAVNEWSES